MRIDHRKLGPLEYGEDRVVTLEEGILGFSEVRKYVLVDVRENSAFRWLASVDHPDLAFVVADPFAFFRDYQAPMEDRDLESLRFREGDELVLLAVVSIRGRRKEDTTFNLRAPIVLNLRTLLGKQVVLKEEKWGVRVPLPVAEARDAKVAGEAGAQPFAEGIRDLAAGLKERRQEP